MLCPKTGSFQSKPQLKLFELATEENENGCVFANETEQKELPEKYCVIKT